MKRIVSFILIALSAVSIVLAQKEFLTSDEIERVREAQDPNLRLKTYLAFARLRMDQLKQVTEKERKGRSIQVRDILDQYTSILDAIDTVSDDALKRKVDIAEGADAVVGAERSFLGTLKKIQTSRPSDLDMYEISLKEAIAITEDSLGTAEQDLTRRQTTLLDKAEDEKIRIKEATSSAVAKEQEKENAKTEGPKNPDGTRRKPPTLYKPGEKPPATKP
ncbi:MAG: hypothetical protein JWN34_2513 [Bryobacterales bacterium]|nr:hypothetical protein [Bryobacterales bacterium]